MHRAPTSFAEDVTQSQELAGSKPGKHRWASAGLTFSGRCEVEAAAEESRRESGDRTVGTLTAPSGSKAQV